MPRAQGEIRWHPREYVTVPRGNLVEVLRDHWWPINDKGEIAIYHWYSGESPQANIDKRIVDRLAPEGAVDAIHLPFAFMPHKCERY